MSIPNCPHSRKVFAHTPPIFDNVRCCDEHYGTEGPVMDSTVQELLEARKEAELCEVYLHLRALL